MKNKKIKFISWITIFIFVLSLTTYVPVFAQENKLVSNNNALIITNDIPEDLEKYAFEIFPKHVTNMSKAPEKFGFNSKEISYLYLGKPFNISVYQNDDLLDNIIYYYPVIYKNTIKGFLIVGNDNGKYSSTFEKGFSEKVDNLIKNNNGKFSIVNIDNNLLAISSDESVLISEDTINFNKVDKDKMLRVKNKLTKDKQNNSKFYDIMLTDESTSSSLQNITINSTYSTSSTSRLLNVPIVSQYSYDWCWAAVCASIINYKQSKFLTAGEVVTYVYGAPIDKGGDWPEMKKAYNHWGLYPWEEGYLAYWAAKNCIDNGQPIHMRMKASLTEGHSMVLCGYEEFSSTSKLYTPIVRAM